MTNDNDNVVQFPGRRPGGNAPKLPSNTANYPLSPYQDISITFSFDTPELNNSGGNQHTVNTGLISWNQTEFANAADELSRIVDLCAALQKNSAQQALRGNSYILTMIEDCLREAISISKIYNSDK